MKSLNPTVEVCIDAAVKEMSLNEALELDYPEGRAHIHLSATRLYTLLEAVEDEVIEAYGD